MNIEKRNTASPPIQVPYPQIHRADSAKPFYIRDSSIRRVWYPQEVGVCWNQSPVDTEGMTVYNVLAAFDLLLSRTKT